MTAHTGRLEAWLAAYGNHDRETMRDSLADDAVWHVGGTHRFSGSPGISLPWLHQRSTPPSRGTPPPGHR